MANFGLADLRLVPPRDGWPQERAWASASGANWPLDARQGVRSPGRRHRRSHPGPGHHRPAPRRRPAGDDPARRRRATLRAAARERPGLRPAVRRRARRPGERRYRPLPAGSSPRRSTRASTRSTSPRRWPSPPMSGVWPGAPGRRPASGDAPAAGAAGRACSASTSSSRANSTPPASSTRPRSDPRWSATCASRFGRARFTDQEVRTLRGVVTALVEGPWQGAGEARGEEGGRGDLRNQRCLIPGSSP